MKTLSILLTLVCAILLTPAAIAATDRCDSIPRQLFAEAPLVSRGPGGQAQEVLDILNAGADLLLIYELVNWTGQRGSAYYPRRITRTTVAIGVDTTSGLAWQQRYVAKTKIPVKEKSKGATWFRKRLARRRKLPYDEVVNAFVQLDAMGFHQLDPGQLTSTKGPLRADGSQQIYSISHATSSRVFLQANSRYYLVTAFAPGIMYDHHPDLYPDRKVWLEGYAMIRALTEQ